MVSANQPTPGVRLRLLAWVTAGLVVVVVTGLVIGIGLNTRYFLDAQLWATLSLGALMVTLIAVGFRLMLANWKPDGTASPRAWLGAAVVWITVVTPVVVGIVWWAFFSGGDF